MIPLFENYGESNSRNTKYQFWIQDNYPIELISPKWILQKLDYIHSNPVTAGIVDVPNDYLYSSAKDYYGEKGILDIDILDTGSDLGYVFVG